MVDLHIVNKVYIKFKKWKKWDSIPNRLTFFILSVCTVDYVL